MEERKEEKENEFMQAYGRRVRHDEQKERESKMMSVSKRRLKRCGQEQDCRQVGKCISLSLSIQLFPSSFYLSSHNSLFSFPLSLWVPLPPFPRARSLCWSLASATTSTTKAATITATTTMTMTTTKTMTTTAAATPSAVPTSSTTCYYQRRPGAATAALDV